MTFPGWALRDGDLRLTGKLLTGVGQRWHHERQQDTCGAQGAQAVRGSPDHVSLRFAPACGRMRDASATARSDEVTMAPETEDRMSLGAARREKGAMPVM